VRERKLEKDLKRRRKKKSAEERGEDLQDTVARRPGELPPPLRKLLKKLIHHFLIWGDSRRLRLRLPGPKSSPLCPQSLSKCCLSLKKIKSFLKQSVLLGENPLRGVSPRLRKSQTVMGFSNNINP